MEKSTNIPTQTSLPFNVAVDIVMQGFRIRFGRSLITVFGVLLGIMFLASALTTFIISVGVHEEDQLRNETSRMKNFLLAETGAIANRTLGVIQTGRLNEVESRLVKSMLAEKPEAILAMNFVNDTTPPGTRPADFEEMTADSKAIVVLGDSALSQNHFDRLASLGFDRPIAFSRLDSEELPQNDNFYLVSITGKLTPEDLRRQEQEKRTARSRLIWILVISLLVTIISISNAMLMSVAERFREIGTMKCLGADSHFVRRLFLIESSLIGLSGGLGGALLGAGLTIAFHCFVYGPQLVFTSMNYPALVGSIAAGTAAGVALSVLAAIYPAGVASAMIPANALRSNV